MVDRDKQPLKIIEFSDVHLGHRQNRSRQVTENVTQMFKANPELQEADIIFIAGDLFDRLQTLISTEINEVHVWATGLIKYCETYDILLYIMEGTPYHDRKQGKILEDLAIGMGLGHRVKYIDILTIEHISVNGHELDVLFIPDEWRPNPDTTWEEVNEALRSRGLTKVHFCIMHGAFEYHLPAHINHNCHQYERYADITTFKIFIGHIHKPSEYGKALTAGSTDRFCFNETEDKGMWFVTIYDTRIDCKFIINTNATIYDTYDVREMHMEQIHDLLERKSIDELPDGSNIRLHCNDNDVIVFGVKTLEEQHPHITFKLKKERTTVDEREVASEELTEIRMIDITATSIDGLLSSVIKEQTPDITDTELESTLTLLQFVKNEVGKNAKIS